MAELDITFHLDSDGPFALLDMIGELTDRLRSLQARAFEQSLERFLQFGGLGEVGGPAVVAGHLRLALKLTDDGALLMSALRTLGRDLGAIEGLLVEHSSSPGVVATTGDAESPDTGSRPQGPAPASGDEGGHP